MTEHMLIVFGILAGAVVLFASGRVRFDVVANLVVLELNRRFSPYASGSGIPHVDAAASPGPVLGSDIGPSFLQA